MLGNVSEWTRDRFASHHLYPTRPGDGSRLCSGQSLPFAFIAAACFISSSVISGGPGLKVISWIVPVKRNGGW